MDLGPLPGDAGAIRAAAADLDATVPQLRTAHVAAVRLGELLDGDHWQGDAFQAFTRVVERKPLPAALERAVDRMRQAAEQLRWFAARFDENQQALAHLRAQAAAVQSSIHGIDPSDPASQAAAEAAAAELRAIEQRARAVHDDHRHALDEVAATFDWLSDEPTFAEPPPSTWERLTGAVGDAAGVAWSFGTGVVEGVRDMAIGIYELGELLLTPSGWSRIMSSGDEILAVLQYAWEHPLEFLGEVGSALLDLDTLREDPARWLGRRVPDLVLAIATAGAGSVAARAAGSVRGVRSARVAEHLLGREPLAVGRAASAERLSSADGIIGRYVRVGVDESRLAQVGSGAYARTDTPLGRVALSVDRQLDGLPHGTGLRQAPGLLLDEIRGVIDVPVDAALRGLSPDRPLPAEPWVRRTVANAVTGGFTGDLALIDGLLVGAPALSPGAYGTIAGVQALDLADRAAGIHGAAEAVLATPR